MIDMWDLGEYLSKLLDSKIFDAGLYRGLYTR